MSDSKNESKFKLTASVLILVFLCLGVGLGGAYRMLELIEEKHWSPPVILGFSLSFLLYLIGLRVGSLVFKAMGVEKPVDIFREKPFWIESLDSGILGGVYGFLLFIFIQLISTFLNIPLTNTQIGIYLLVWAAICAVGVFSSYLKSEDLRGTIFFAGGGIIGASLASLVIITI